MSAPLERILARLEGVKANGAGFIARCPAHEDHRQSLSVSEGEDGRVLLNCFAGCQAVAICEAIDMKLADLFPAKEKRSREILATYDYTDEAGGLLYQVVRFAPKDFRQRRPDGAGGWIWNLKDTRRVLFGLPAILEAVEVGMTVWVAEGEKDVLVLRGIGGLATCNPAGAGKWRDEYSEVLRGARVAIVADRDEPGREHAQQIAASLEGVAATVRIVEAAEGKDAADHIAAGYGLEEFVELAEESPEGPPADPQPTAPTACDYHMTDLGNAERFVDDHLPLTRFVRGQGWLTYGATGCFAEDPGAVRRLAIATVRKMYAEIADLDEADKRKSLSAHARNSESAARLEAILTIACNLEGAEARIEELNADPMLLNAPNGVVDLETGELRPHDPALLMTQCAGVPYEPQASCPLWLAHLKRVFAGRGELIDFFQTLCGYAATGHTREQKLVILYGTGQNGKGVTVGAISAALGDYADDADFSSFTVRRSGNDGPREDLARLYGRRLVSAGEGNIGATLDEAMIKRMTGGTGSDLIVCRHLYKGTFVYKPEFQVMLSTNHLPRIRGTDHGIWRRVLQIPFDVTIPDEEKDDRIEEKLQTELPGILAWTVRGALRWGNEGLQVPADVEAATRAYREDQDVLADFLAAECDVEDSLSSTVGALHKAHSEWAERDGAKKLSSKAFKAMLLERGFADLGREPGTGRALIGGLALSAHDSQTGMSDL